MILNDFSGLLIRMLFASVKIEGIREIDGKLVTEDFIKYTIDLVIKELVDTHNIYSREYGDMVILLDDHTKQYWRKEFYPLYKMNRAKSREDSNIDFAEFFKYSNEMIEILKEHFPWKTFHVKSAEADDTILVLSREFSKREKILILSADKDMIQAQRFTDNVKQYSALTKKWIKAENKHENMNEWVLEHVILGDASDGVPKIVQHADFSQNFKQHLINNGIDDIFLNVKEFKEGVHIANGIVTNTISEDKKRNLLQTYDVWCTNKKGEKTELDVYENPRFGPSTIKKCIKTHKTLDNWLDSHPLYRKHYERNFTLVMEEGIPEPIWKQTLVEFENAKTDFNYDKIVEWCGKHNLTQLKQDIKESLTVTEELTVENCGW